MVASTPEKSLLASNNNSGSEITQVDEYEYISGGHKKNIELSILKEINSGFLQL